LEAVIGIPLLKTAISVEVPPISTTIASFFSKMAAPPFKEFTIEAEKVNIGNLRAYSRSITEPSL
jgi:hypothetical protein